MGSAKEDPRGCDEGTWFVRVVSSLVAPVRDIVTGVPSPVLVVVHPSTGPFILAAGRPHSLLYVVYLQRHDGSSIGGKKE